jgi:tetratricopeptide (TPR) repeat protein
MAFWAYRAGRWDEALRRYRELAEQYPENTEYLAALGLLAARRGDRGEALRISEQFRSMRDPQRESGATLTRAKIAALLGDRAQAVTLLQRAIDLGHNWGHGIWLYNDVDLHALRDYPPFQDFMRPKG